MESTHSQTAIGLLYQGSGLPDNLKQALADVGIVIAMESSYSDFEADALDGLDVRAVIINLEDEDDDDLLDQVSGKLDGLGCEVVYNDAMVSGDLSGWDQARWARHLASKISGASDIHPPRPVGAEAIPQRAAVVAQASAGVTDAQRADAKPVISPSAAASASDWESDEQSTAAETPAVPVEDPPSDGPQIDEPDRDGHDIGDPDTDRSDIDEIDPDQQQIDDPERSDLEMGEAFQFEPVSEPADDAAAPQWDAQAESEDAEYQNQSETLGEIESFLDEVPSGVELAGEAGKNDEQATVEAADVGLDSLFDDIPDGLDLAADDSTSVASFSSYDQDFIDSDDEALGSEAAELAEQLEQSLAAGVDAKEDSPQLEDHFKGPDAAEAALDDMGRLEEGQQDGKELLDASPAEQEAETATANSSLPLELSLLDDEQTETAPAEKKASSESSYDFSSMSFELEALEEESESAAENSPLNQENWLEAPAKKKLPATEAASLGPVWVLGASIGGPEAIREFLAAFPEGYKGTFVLAQHMGAEFQELMTAQLDKATPLRVRLAADGDSAEGGDVLVVPVGKKFSLHQDGRVRLDDQLEQSAYNPSIDNVIRDISEVFGTASGAIIFSGMARDAIEGCSALREKGGQVWVQDPSSCVISSMIDGVRERKLDTFMGTPKQLAEKFLSDIAT